jgi:non-specific serine/threonine protein kinase
VSGVFISYRREDSAGWTGRIYDRTCVRFGSDRVFLDVEAIAPGEDFAKAIEDFLRQVDAVLVVIGPQWLSITDSEGRRRLEDPSDYVRREIAAALEFDARVVPVLVDGSGMPSEAELPADVGALARRNAVAVGDTRFDRDIDRLLEALGLADTGAEILPNNLPTQHTPFIGRADEIRATKGRLGEDRLVSLVGAGGSGKTRLALEVAREVSHRYDEGAWFVDFRQIEEPREVVPLVASSLQVVAAGSDALADQLADSLAARRLLLVLDNCEHVLDGVVPFTRRLLSRTGELRILVTSREPLGHAGETVIQLPPLPVPESSDLEDLMNSAAARLFSDRAAGVNADFALAENSGAVFDICRAVDGLPLALELAAARVRALSPQDIAARLDNQLRILKSGRRADDGRHATIEDTIRWSWDLLDEAEQVLFARISVFRGSWTLDAAEGVCGYEPMDRSMVLDLVGSLVDKSLVTVDRGSGQSVRFRLLEPIRQYAARQLNEDDDGDLRGRFIDYWRTLIARPATTGWRSYQKDIEHARSFEEDVANLAAAVDRAFALGRRADAMAIVGNGLGDLLLANGSAFPQVERWMRVAVKHSDQIPPAILLPALAGACSIAATEGHNETWLEWAELGKRLAPSPQEHTWWRLDEAIARNRMGDRDQAAKLLDAIVAESSDPGAKASALLAQTQFAEPQRAWLLAKRAMKLASPDSFGFYDEAVATWFIADAAGDVGEYGVALDMGRRCLILSKRWGWVAMHAYCAQFLGWVYMTVGRLDEATAVIEDALPASRRLLEQDVIRHLLSVRAADAARLSGRFNEARDFVAEARRAAARDDLTWWRTIGAARYSALIARDEGDLDLARAILSDAVPRAEGFGSAEPAASSAFVHLALASVDLRAGDSERALASLRRVFAERERLVHPQLLEALDAVGIALTQQERAEPAAHILGAVDRERQRTGAVCPPPDVTLRQSAIGTLGDLLGDDAEAAFTEGRSMDLDGAAAFAIDHLGV